MSDRQRWSLAGYGLAVVVAAMWTLILRVGSPTVVLWFANLGLSGVALAASASCLMTARRTSGRLREVWGLLAASCGSWGLGQVAWTFYESVLQIEGPFPSLADVGYVFAVPLAVLALLRLPLGPLPLASQIRAVLDGLLIGASLLLLSWISVLRPLVDAGGETWLAQMFSLYYPLGDTVLITIVIYVLLRSRSSARAVPVPIAMIGVSLAGLAIADAGFAYLQLSDSYASGSVIDTGWFLGYALLLVTACRQSVVRVQPQHDQMHRPLGTLLPYASVALAVVVSSVEILRTGHWDPVVSWIRSLLLVALVVRQVLTLRENVGLTRGLEQRVIDRTAELLHSQQRFEALVQHSSDVVTILDEEARVVYQSESAARVFGFTDGMIGTSFLDRILPADRERFRWTLREAAQTPLLVVRTDARLTHADGRMCYIESTVTNLLAEPSVRGLVLNTRDVSERKQLEQQLVHDASHDSLTTLANRALFERMVRRRLVRASGTGGEVAVLFLDLDGFKEVNDSLGHAYGDLLLISVAERLRNCVRTSDTVARLGGDEFAVVVAGAQAGQEAITLADRVAATLREPFMLQEKEIHVRASIGISVAEPGTIDAGHLLRNADLAMYRSKAAGEGKHVVFDPDMHADLVQRLELGTDLRRAIRERQIQVHYQPTVALVSGAIVGVEALARWQHPERGEVPPSVFIPLAEDSGLIHELGELVLHEACRQAVEWREEYPELPLKVAVNLSGRQLNRPDVVSQVKAALDSTGLDPHSLVLEVTESVLMEHSDENLGRLRELRALGVQLALDDFGTGYSSLSYLQRFPVDILKIDRSFIEGITGPDTDDGFIRSILFLSSSLRLSTVAEGIEDHRQMLALRRLGCTEAQGYHISRPVSARDLRVLLEEQAVASTLPAAASG